MASTSGVVSEEEAAGAIASEAETSGVVASCEAVTGGRYTTGAQSSSEKLQTISTMVRTRSIFKKELEMV